MLSLTESQIEVLNLEKIVGGDVNTICCVLFLPKHLEDKAFQEIISETVREFPLLDAIVDKSLAGLNCGGAMKALYETRSFLNEELYLEWIEGLKQSPLNPHERLAEIIPFAIGDNKSGILIRLHHVIADGWSVCLLLRSFIERYRLYPCGQKTETKEISYAQYVGDEKEYLASKRIQRDIRYWQNVFARKIQPSCLRSSDGVDFTAERWTVELSPKNVAAIKAYANQESCTPYAIVLTAVSLCLHRVMAEDSFYVGTLLLNRATTVEKQTFGNFFNTAFLPISIQEGETFLSLSKKLMTDAMALMRHQRLSYTRVVDEYRKAGGQATSLFDVLVSYQDVSEFDGIDDCEIQWYGVGRQLETLQINIEAHNDILRIHYDYRRDRMCEKEVVRFHNRMLTLLKSGIENNNEDIHCLNQISDEDINKLKEWNQTVYPYPSNESLCLLFERRVRQQPNSIALRMGNAALTYDELNKRSNKLAHKLIDLGVQSGDIVAIMAERSFEMIVGIYAIQKAGAAYMPIGTDYPEDRIRFMIEDSESRILLTQSKWDCVLADETVRINMDMDDFIEYSDENPLQATSEGIAYVIYTSGSTGKPKGAMIQHRSAINRIHWMNRIFGMSEEDIILQKTPYTFDVSVWELFWWGMYGGSLALLEPEGHKDPESIIQAVEKYGITKMHFVPSMLAAFLEYLDVEKRANELHSLKQVFVSGEALLSGHVNRFYELVERAELVNLYGPTECTVDVSCFRCPRKPLSSIPIGRPVDNTQLYVVDKWNSLVPVGDVGELCIAGDLVGLGYIKREELTREKFIDNPFGQGKLYKTGDLAAWNSEGNLEYMGRIDFQVKLHGQRIELGEIERRVVEYPGINQAVATVQKEHTGMEQLVVHYSGMRAIDEVDLKRCLLEVMPEYMVPQGFLYMDELPLSSNGKIDRKKLPLIHIAEQLMAREYVAPTTQIQCEFCEAYAKVLELRHSDVSATDSFFDLGGTSLLAIALMTELHANYSFTLSDFYENPTPVALEKLYLTRRAKGDDLTDAYSEDEGYRELNLSALANPGWKNSSGVLLTGATGFLGVHLLYELLRITTCEIVCLVRNIEKLKAHWHYMFADEVFPEDRISFAVGDIREKMLGLDESRYESLTNRIDIVFHAAADVRHFGVWVDSYRTNTVGTENVIRFCQDADAQMHHVSTMSVNGYVLTGMNSEQGDDFTENNLYIGQRYRENIYVHSKYNAEKAMINAIRNGLKANIYRIGNLLWRHSDGKFQENREVHDFYMLSHAFLKLGMCVKEYADLRIDFTSVDSCAEAICVLAQRDLGRIHHIMNPNDLTLAEYLNSLVGYKLPISEMDTFIHELEEHEDDPQMGFMLAYAAINKSLDYNAYPKEKCEQTIRQLARWGYQWEIPSTQYLQYVL